MNDGKIWMEVLPVMLKAVPPYSIWYTDSVRGGYDTIGI